MPDKETMSAAAAARIIGCSPQMVRERIKRRIWTFGDHIPKEKTGKTQDSFIIFTKKLNRFLGG